MSDVGIPVTDAEAAELPAAEVEVMVEENGEQFIAVTGHAPLYVPKGVTFEDILARLEALEGAKSSDAKPATKKKA